LKTLEKIERNHDGSPPRKFEQLIGRSPALEAVLEQVKRVAPTGSTVLIQGETGTGKELIARAIHNISSRCGRPFIKLNCAAIPLDLLESELFGHEKGAFTGAIAQKLGRFEIADQGTLFLDEVGDIPPALQPKLLHVLQEQEFERLGSCRTHHVDVRLVAATNRDLSEMTRGANFAATYTIASMYFRSICRRCVQGATFRSTRHVP
jgi:formate hydrogenlyase transcriptional activator